MTSNNPVLNDNGFTLLELIVSILVGSMVISMLMSILTRGMSSSSPLFAAILRRKISA